MILLLGVLQYEVTLDNILCTGLGFVMESLSNRNLQLAATFVSQMVS